MQKSKAVAVITLMFLILACFNPACLAASFGDISNHWAKDYIAEMVDQGIISGYPDGTFKPEGKITRAEFASLLVRGFQLPIGGSKVFSDTANHWAKDFIAAAYSQGIISGYSEYEFGPDDPITREQMAVMIVKAARPDADVEGKTFADNNSIADWARQAVIIATGNNIISGYPDNTFRPKSNTTRAEAAVVLSKALHLKASDKEKLTPVEENYSLIDKAGTYGPATGTKTVEGNVTVKSPDVTLRNLIITGNLIIAEEVGDGDVTLDNVTVKGKTYIRGGGKDSIYINGGQYNEVIVEKIATKAVRIVAEDVKGLKITIAKEAAGKEIILKGDIDFVSVRADDIKVTTQADTNINEIRVQSGLDDVDIYLDEGTIVDEMVLYSAVAVQGKGKIKEASGSKAKESSFATEPGRVTAPPAGGGGGGSSSTAVSAISVTPTTMTLTVGTTGTITATVEPENATNKNVTWSSSNTDVATVANGVVTAVAPGTATITATSAANSSKKASCEVIVKAEEPVEPTPIQASFVSIGNVGIAPDTAGEAAGKIYAEYKLVAEGKDISLASDNVEYIKVKVGDGGWANLTPNTDATLWFNVEAATGLRTFEVKTKGEDANVYVATLDWKEEINNVSFTATGREGTRPETEDAYVEFEILVDSQRVSLAEGAVKLIAQKADGKWVELEPNTDETLWFKKDKATGTYEFFVVTSAGVMYKATLEWPGEGVYDALAEVNGVEAGANYGQNERKAMRQALEKNEKILGLDLTEYNKITVEGRKDAVGWDLLANRPAEGYTVETLQSMLDEIVLTRQTTEASLNMVNAAESLTDIGFATMLLDRFKAAKDENYTIHSGLQVTDKITMLEDLVGRYNRLGDDGKAAVLAKIIEKRPADGFGRSQATTDALAAALTEVETEINARLKITSVTIADNTAYASTAAGEGNTVRVLGYGVGINLDANNSGKKVSDTTSIVIELYKDKTLLGQQIFKGFEKHANASTISGTIDAGGQYVATSWENSWSAKIDEIPTRAVAIVQYTDGIATAEKSLSFTDTKIFEAAEAVYALFTNPLDDVDELVLADGVTQGKISAASTLVEAVSGGSSHKTLFGEMITKANSLLNPDQGSEDNEETGNGQ